MLALEPFCPRHAWAEYSEEDCQTARMHIRSGSNARKR